MTTGGVEFWISGGYGGDRTEGGMASRRMGLTTDFFTAPRAQINAMISGLRNLVAGERLRGMIGRYAGQAVARNFRTQGDGKWAPLREKTLKDRRREGFPDGPPLIRGGGLFAAATSKLKVDAYSTKGLVIRPTLNPRTGYRKKNSTVYQYWGYHQGTRPFFYLSPKDLTLIGQIMWSVVLGQATKVAKNTGRDSKVRGIFDVRMKALGAASRDFLNSDALIETTRVNINLLRRG